MGKKTIVIAAVACHFEEAGKLCLTTMRRLELALTRAGCYAGENEEVVYLVTGDVPFEKGKDQRSEQTLAWLQREYLVNRGVSWKKVFIMDGVGLFSEARNTTEFVRNTFPNCWKFIIFSSNWYFWPGKLIWWKAARKSGLRAEFVPVYKNGGSRTKWLYGAYAVVVWGCLFIGLVGILDLLMTQLQSRRVNSFKFVGCG